MRKAQLQMMQSIFALMIVIFIGAIAFFFIFVQQKQSAKLDIQQQVILAETRKYQIINNLPEIHCSDDGVIIRDCVDRYNIESFRTRINEDLEFYYGYFGNSKIAVLEYTGSGWSETLIYDNAKDDYTQMVPVQIPVVVLDPETNKKSYGLIKVEFYT